MAFGQMGMMTTSIVIFAKQPVEGRTKTRLGRALGMDYAAKLAECFIRDTLALVRNLAIGQKNVAYSPEEARDYFRDLVKPLLEFSTYPQRGQDLGERVQNTIQRELTGGAGSVVVLDTDSPTLPAGYIVQAFEMLKRADFVLGPTYDGGCYLIGAALPSTTPLSPVPWGTPQVFRKIVHNLSTAGLKLAVTPPWYDVDTEHGFEMLKSHIEALTYSGVEEIPTHTAAWLTTMRDHPSR